jgi:hypothetical protein
MILIVYVALLHDAVRMSFKQYFRFCRNSGWSILYFELININFTNSCVCAYKYNASVNSQYVRI